MHECAIDLEHSTLEFYWQSVIRSGITIPEFFCWQCATSGLNLVSTTALTPHADLFIPSIQQLPLWINQGDHWDWLESL